jgi:hypothetical protein
MYQVPSSLRGSLRVDLSAAFARTLIIPLEVLLSTTDRSVDLVREGSTHW